MEEVHETEGTERETLGKEKEEEKEKIKERELKEVRKREKWQKIRLGIKGRRKIKAGEGKGVINWRNEAVPKKKKAEWEAINNRKEGKMKGRKWNKNGKERLTNRKV